MADAFLVPMVNQAKKTGISVESSYPNIKSVYDQLTEIPEFKLDDIRPSSASEDLERNKVSPD